MAALILSIIYKSGSKHKKKYAFAFYASISILMLINAIYFKQFNALTSIMLLTQMKQLNTIGDSLKVLLNVEIIALIIDLPIILIYSWFKSKKTIAKTEGSTSLNYLKNPKILAMALVLLFSVNTINGQVKSIVSQELFSYHLIDMKNNLIPKDELAEASEVLTQNEIDELISRRNLEDGKLTGIGKDKNLITIQVEALQNFVIDLEYNGQEITPNLNKLIKDQASLYYNNYYQLTGRGNTSDAEFASLNSMYPSINIPTYHKYADNTFYGLPKLLKDNGYTPWAFHGYVKEFWNRDKVYGKQGFERFISEENFVYDDTIGFGLKDEDFFNQSMEYIKRLDKIDDNPFFAFMITLTSHTPYGLPEEYKEILLKEEHEGTLVGNYLQAIHYTDKQLGKFIEGLKKEGLYDHTLIAIYGDHFAIPYSNEPERDNMTALLGEEYDFDSMMNIPLIIHIPGAEINETINNIGSQLDFYPTMANIMGVKIEKGLICGRDMNNYKGKNQVYPIMYMTMGSFIDNDIVFELSKDNIFDHSRAKSIKTGQPLDINKYKNTSKKALNEIYKSNYILKLNLLKTLIPQVYTDKDELFR